jgi:hypothetical protein
MILRLDSNAGIIKIGSPPEELPGIFESIKISNSLLKENIEMQGRSGKVKIVHGWDDVAIMITLSLIDNPGAGQTRWDSLNHIAAVFKKVAANEKPEIYTLSHPMINAWGTKQVLFSTLETTEYRKQRKIAVTLVFEEYDSAPGLIQARQSSSEAAAEANQPDLSAAQERMLVSDSQRAGLGRQEERFANL